MFNVPNTSQGNYLTGCQAEGAVNLTSLTSAARAKSITSSAVFVCNNAKGRDENRGSRL
jgi:hypothetical protein